MAFILKDGDKVGMRFSVTDAEGNPAAYEGPVAWTCSDESLVRLEQDAEDANLMHAVSVEGPGLGTVTITATVDADTGEGVREITGTGDIEVVAADASVTNIEFGTPEPR